MAFGRVGGAEVIFNLLRQGGGEREGIGEALIADLIEEAGEVMGGNGYAGDGVEPGEFSAVRDEGMRFKVRIHQRLGTGSGS